jgi:predicted secreted hydrolase
MPMHPEARAATGRGGAPRRPRRAGGTPDGVTGAVGRRPCCSTGWARGGVAPGAALAAGSIAFAEALLCSSALAQDQGGFAGLGEDVEGFAQVTAPAALEFPRDHAAHPDYRIEWWYLTVALEGEDGRDYGAQWTLFRQALEPGPQREGWASQQIWNAHAAVTTEDAHLYAERFARGGIGQAGVEAEPFRAWIDDWEMAGVAGAGDGLDALRVTAAGEGFAIDLEVTAEGPLVLHGQDGFSVKSELGQASYYYSQPFYRAAGVLTVEGEEIAVEGTGWLDREWSSQPLTGDQEGWDWVALHLDDGRRVMAAQLRSATQPWRIGTWIDADGTARALTPDEIALEPTGWAEVAGREVPVAWHVAVPGEGLAVDIAAVNAQSWMGTMVEYWEGPVRVTGSHAGRGYLEMTGY